MFTRKHGERLSAPEITETVERIVQARSRTAAHQSMLVAVSGIDGSGKGFVTARYETRTA